ncbi:5-methylcytosine-specific restriction enzyme A [Streptomyces sp. LaPpAH-199]|uniref:HNH endonuclease n=1 Tax=Streptomyces TaxID=1883 RepID=UPI000881F08B|nr:HNH endonuclease [Streptomyces sp. LaPpAH-199]MYW82021.1 HNH endonuclease [Streptomyces sp. SID8369]SDC24220.1 5-methylcytosine-specific restriction enzyme A [Streptomyces sp. LaPpAH-199]
MRKGAITPGSILKAIAEYDQLGRDEFLAKYGFAAALSYVVVHEGRDYDSKAIAGVAHQWDHGRPLRPDEFSGGKDHAVAWLERAGFQVKAVRNPDWARDEIILACQLVMENGWKGLDAQDARVVELSALLPLLPIHAEAERNEKFRNPNGVARKTFDIATRHPAYQGKPTKGGALDVAVLEEFLARPEEMTEVATLIRQGTDTGELQTLPPTDDEVFDDDYSAPEGRLLMRRHQARERNKSLRKKKIASVIQRGGRLECEACGFDFEAVYGDRGAGYIECHQVLPLHVAGEGQTKLSDLALICANCHRMIHRRAPWPTPEELRASIERKHAADRRAAETLARPRRAADEQMPSTGSDIHF